MSPAPPTTPAAPAGWVIGGLCSIRPTRRGIWPMSSSAPRWPPDVQLSRLVATLLAFFCAVGLAAHALDELHGRPLHTAIPTPALVAVSVIGLAGAVGLGALGVAKVGWVLLPFIAVGPLLVIAYNAELFGGLVHTDAGFALSWGAFPVLTAYVAQTSGSLSPSGWRPPAPSACRPLSERSARRPVLSAAASPTWRGP